MEQTSKEHRHSKKAAGKEDVSFRCCCGNLLARLVAEGVEVKCRRCKRRVIVPLQTMPTERGTTQSGLFLED